MSLTTDQDNRLTKIFNERRWGVWKWILGTPESPTTERSAEDIVLSTYDDLQTLRQEVGELRADVVHLTAKVDQLLARP